jgi:putative transposase
MPWKECSVMDERMQFVARRLAGEVVRIKEVHDDIWLLSFMDYDLGYFDSETRVEPLENPFGPKMLPI